MLKKLVSEQSANLQKKLGPQGGIYISDNIKMYLKTASKLSFGYSGKSAFYTIQNINVRENCEGNRQL